MQYLIDYSVKNIKFYSNFFKQNNLKTTDIKRSEDLVKLPVITKEVYRENFPNNIVDLNSKKKDLILNSTSGSTGTPFKFYQTRRLRGQSAARLIFFYEWAGRLYGEPLARMWGHVNSNFKIKFFNKYIENALVVNAFDLGEHTFPRYFKKIQKKQPKLLESYTSAAYAFSILLNKKNLSLNIPSTIVSGETLYDFQIKLIKESLNTELYNRYGCREFGNIAQECSKHKGMHIYQEEFIIEILDENNNPVKEGEKGKIVVTALDNYSMPFIRYQIDDIGVISTKDCTCGRNLRMFESIQGRVTDMIYSPSGKHISLYFFALIFQELSDYISEFQVLQKKKSDELILRVIPTKKFNDTIKSRIINQVMKMDDSFMISVDKVDEIKPEPFGKKKYLKVL
ncbi:MAG: phenylacetate--CoA ligase family protein [Candidatus Odinarchaeota archaeon]